MEWEQGAMHGKDKSLNKHVPINAAMTGEFESELQHTVNIESSYTIFTNNYSSKGTIARKIDNGPTTKQIIKIL